MASNFTLSPPLSEADRRAADRAAQIRYAARNGNAPASHAERVALPQEAETPPDPAPVVRRQGPRPCALHAAIQAEYLKMLERYPDADLTELAEIVADRLDCQPRQVGHVTYVLRTANPHLNRPTRRAVTAEQLRQHGTVSAAGQFRLSEDAIEALREAYTAERAARPHATKTAIRQTLAERFKLSIKTVERDTNGMP